MSEAKQVGEFARMYAAKRWEIRGPAGLIAVKDIPLVDALEVYRAFANLDADAFRAQIVAGVLMVQDNAAEGKKLGRAEIQAIFDPSGGDHESTPTPVEPDAVAGALVGGTDGRVHGEPGPLGGSVEAAEVPAITSAPAQPEQQTAD